MTQFYCQWISLKKFLYFNWFCLQDPLKLFFFIIDSCKECRVSLKPGLYFNIKTAFSGTGIPIIKIKVAYSVVYIYIICNIETFLSCSNESRKKQIRKNGWLIDVHNMNMSCFPYDAVITHRYWQIYHGSKIMLVCCACSRKCTCRVLRYADIVLW